MINKNLLRHIEIRKNKIDSGIGAVRRIRPFVPTGTLRYIYNALVQPHFIHCSVVWGNGDKTLSDKLQKLHNRAACIVAYYNDN